jgi:methyl-accepting chemotaxis protein
MDELLNKLKVKSKLLILIFTSLISLIAVMLTSMQTLNHNLLEDRYTKTTHLTEAATDVVNYFYQQSQQGNFTEEEAQKYALESLSTMHYGNKEYFWVNTLDYIMLAHPKQKLIGQDIKNISDPNGIYLFVKMVRIAKAKGGGFVAYQWDREGSSEAIDKISYVKLFQPWGWVIGTGIYIDDVNSIFWDNTINITIVVLSFILLTMWLSYKISRNIYNPLNKMRDLMMEVNSTNNLALTLKVQGNDELAEISNVFNEMLANFKAVLLRISDSSCNLASQAEELSAVTEQINQGMCNQHDDVIIADAASNEMVIAIKEVAENTHVTLEATNKATESTNHCVVVLDKNITSINELNIRIKQSVEQISELKGASRNIGEIVSTIQAIAEQTNLLALNAAIEAARAGEQGRGFAVVAGEVRTLASRTQESTANITSVIETLQLGVGVAVNNMEQCQERANSSVLLATEAGALVQHMQTKMLEVTDLTTMVSAATEEQSATTQQVKEIIVQINVLTEETKISASHTAQSSESLATLAVELNDMVSSFKI